MSTPSTGPFYGYKRDTRKNFGNLNKINCTQAADCLPKGNPRMKSRHQDEPDFLEENAMHPREPRTGPSFNTTSGPSTRTRQKLTRNKIDKPKEIKKEKIKKKPSAEVTKKKTKTRFKSAALKKAEKQFKSLRK